jgi:peroxiredoxin
VKKPRKISEKYHVFEGLGDSYIVRGEEVQLFRMAETEIAKMLGMRRGTVAKRLHDLCSRLRKWPHLGLALLCCAAVAHLVIGSAGGGLRPCFPAEANRARPFCAMDLRGAPTIVAPGEQGPALLLFFCLCPNCQELARGLRSACPTSLLENVQVVGIVDATRSQAAEFQRATRFPGVILADPYRSVHEQYGAKACPAAWLVDANGSIRLTSITGITRKDLTLALHTWSDRFCISNEELTLHQ